MNRQEKQAIIDSLKNDFAHSQASFLIGVQGMTVEQIQILRKDLHKKDSKIKVAKNTLVKRAVQGMAGAEGLQSYLKDEIAVVFAMKEPPVVAKTLSEYSKKVEKLKIVAGFMDAEAFGKNKVDMLATMPSREVLIARICGALKLPMARLAQVIKLAAEKE